MRNHAKGTDWVRVLKKPRTLRPVWVCLGLGMVATIVQAWTQAAFFPRLIETKYTSESTDGRCRTYTTVLPFRNTHIPTVESFARTSVEPVRWFATPKYAEFLGWPFESMAAFYEVGVVRSPQDRAHVSIGIALPWTRDHNGSHIEMPRVLPVVPMLGFWQNTPVYALAVGAVWAGLVVVRRVRFGRASRCGACGYDAMPTMRVCPECGWELQSPRTAHGPPAPRADGSLEGSRAVTRARGEQEPDLVGV